MPPHELVFLDHRVAEARRRLSPVFPTGSGTSFLCADNYEELSDAHSYGAVLIREFSSGVIPFRMVRGKRKYLILRSGLTRGELWEFPKGHIEKGEDSRIAALREFEEETGLPECRLIPGFRKILKYFYRRGKDLVSKSVTYYLGEVKGGEVKLSHESTDSRWVTAGEAQLYMRHKNLLEVLQEAEDFLNKSSEQATKEKP